MKSKKAVKKQRVHVHFMQDRSGSMVRQWEDCVGGFAAFVRDLQTKEDVEYSLSLTIFNHMAETVLNRMPVEKVSLLALSNYQSSGGTALYDTLGKVLTETNDSEFDKAIFIIVTDGQEVDSCTWTKDTVHALIDAKLREGFYTFQYLGSQPETWADAAKAGFSVGQTVSFNNGNYIGTYAAVASGINNFSSSSLRSTRSMTASFADQDLIKSANMCVVKEDDISK